MSDQTMFDADQASKTVQADQQKQEVQKENPTTSPFDEFVGEGKKYKTVDEFVKGFVNANQHIENLTKDNEELREEIGKRKSAEDVLNDLQSKSSEKGSTSPSVSEDEIKRLIAKAVPESLNQQRQIELATTNIQEVTSTLLSKFGTKEKVDAFIGEKSRELGVGFEKLKELAAASPKAFYNTIGIESGQSSNNAVTSSQSDVNTAIDFTKSSNDESSWQYWQKLRKEDPKAYFSPKMSTRRHELVAQGKLTPGG